MALTLVVFSVRAATALRRPLSQHGTKRLLTLVVFSVRAATALRRPLSQHGTKRLLTLVVFSVRGATALRRPLSQHGTKRLNLSSAVFAITLPPSRWVPLRPLLAAPLLDLDHAHVALHAQKPRLLIGDGDGGGGGG